MIPNTTQIITEKITLKRDQIRTLNSNPVELLAAPGAGRFIQILSATARMRDGSIPYTDSEYILIKQGGAHQIMQNGFMLSSINELSAFHAFDNKLMENAPVTIEAYETDPQTGDSECDIYITYFVIEMF